MLPLSTLVSNAPFNGEFYQYKLNGDSGPKGYLTLTPNANEINCPAGRVLTLTGKKLIPQIHPMEFLLGKPNPLPGLLVSAYDNITFMKGFVNPKSPIFIPNALDIKPLDTPKPTDVASGEVAIESKQTTFQLWQKLAFPPGDYTDIPADAANASVGSIVNISGKLNIKIKSSILTPNSSIFVTPLGPEPTVASISNIDLKEGIFTISTGSVCTVNWMILN